MAFSLSALVRGLNQAAAGYSQGRTRGRLTREQLEAARQEREQDAVTRLLEQDLLRRRLAQPERIDPLSAEGIQAQAEITRRIGETGFTRSGQRQRPRPGRALTSQQQRRLVALRNAAPTSPVGTEPSEAGRVRYAYREMLREGSIGPEQVPEAYRDGGAPSAPSAERGSPNPADLWERLVDEGMSEDEATAEVRRRLRP